MPVNTEQWLPKIESFNGCSLHSIAKLYLNLFNLLFNMLLAIISIVATAVYFITKFQFFMYLITLFLYAFIPFLLVSISCSNIHKRKLISSEKPFTNCLYKTSLLIYCIYFCSNIKYRNQYWAKKLKK